MRAIHDDLLDHSEEVAAGPVESDSRSVGPGCEPEDHGHYECHHALLFLIDSWGWCQELRQKHGDDEQDGEYVVRVCRGQVGNP